MLLEGDKISSKLPFLAVWHGFAAGARIGQGTILIDGRMALLLYLMELEGSSEVR